MNMNSTTVETLPAMFGEQNPYAGMMKDLNMSIRELMPMAKGMIPEEKIRELEEKLEELN